VQRQSQRGRGLKGSRPGPAASAFLSLRRVLRKRVLLGKGEGVESCGRWGFPGPPLTRDVREGGGGEGEPTEVRKFASF